MKKGNAFSWDINKTGILDVNGNPIQGYNHITRDDTGASIAVMKDSFVPMTTQEFSETVYAVADKLKGKVHQFNDWDTTDKSKNIGKAQPVITAQMEISEPLEIGGSKIEGKLTLGVGFDGGRSFFIGHTTNYLRCTNAFSSIVHDFKSRLTKNNMIRVEDIIQRIGTFNDYEQKLYENFKKFEEVKVDERLIQECVARLVKLSDEERAMSPKELIDAVSTQKLNKMDDIFASIRPEMAELGNNAWGLFNGVTHYTTHQMKSHGSEELSTLFGAKREANLIGYELCLELLR